MLINEEEGRARIVRLIRNARDEDVAGSSRWREARCRAIHARCATMTGDEYFFAAYTLALFGAADLAQLTDPQLEQTYHHVMAIPGR
ncbi:MAG: hypothetical protein JNL87_09225 [Burkholderiaceae bacterium]|nr:hypothetical protein [Burkholderiaceae bacterium]